MIKGLIDKLVDVLSVGNRPLRIFLFGGVLISYFTIPLLGMVFGIDTDTGADIDIPNAILMTLSIMIGFATSYALMRYLENYRQKRADDITE